jgi:hypothetical protein
MNEQNFLQALRELQLAASKSDAAFDAGAASQLAEAEHLLRVEYALGPDFSPARRRQLLEIHREMAHARDELIHAFLEHRVTPDVYATRLQQVTQQASAAFADALSADEFRKLFGESPAEATAMPLDPALVGHRTH